MPLLLHCMLGKKGLGIHLIVESSLNLIPFVVELCIRFCTFYFGVAQPVKINADIAAIAVKVLMLFSLIVPSVKSHNDRQSITSLFGQDYGLSNFYN